MCVQHTGLKLYGEGARDAKLGKGKGPEIGRLGPEGGR